MTDSISGWDRVAMAIESVRTRLLRCTAALKAASVPYAVIGGNAVAEWVGRIDRGAVRFTKDVDVLLRREDLPWAISVMEKAGFVYAESFGAPIFLDHPGASPRDAVDVIFSGEKVKPQHVTAAPDVQDCESAERFRIVSDWHSENELN